MLLWSRDSFALPANHAAVVPAWYALRGRYLRALLILVARDGAWVLQRLYFRSPEKGRSPYLFLVDAYSVLLISWQYFFNGSAQEALLLFDGQCGIQSQQGKGIGHCFVFMDDALLELTKAGGRISVQTEVYTSLIILQARVIAQYTIERLIRADLEVDAQVWPDSETIDLFNPAAVNATSKVAGQGCVDITVGQYNCATLEARHDVAFMQFGKISGLQNTQEHWIHVALFFPGFQCSFDEFRGSPLRNQYFIALSLQPELEQLQLCAFPGTI